MSHSPRGHKEVDTAEATNANSNIRMLTLGFRSLPDGIFSSHTNTYDCEFHLKEFNSHGENSRALVYKATTRFRKRGKAV